MRIGILVATRIDSTRLPNKVLQTIEGKPILHHLIQRLKKSKFPTLVCTSNLSKDDEIINICKKLDGEYSEDMLNTVSTAGGGSSFGDQPLDTDKRYLWWEEHEDKGYRKVYAREVKKIEEANTKIELY